MSTRCERKGQHAHETVVAGWVPETEEVLFCCLITEVASYTHTHTHTVYRVGGSHALSASPSQERGDLICCCFIRFSSHVLLPNGILLWKDIFFPTLWTLSTDSIHLADSLQESAPL